MGYQGTVLKELENRANVWAPKANGGDSRNVLEHFDEWVTAEKPDILHVNCGLHDLARLPETAEPRVPIDEYRENVHRILSKAMQLPGMKVIWASTTPVNEKWHNENKTFDRLEADIVTYNVAAADVCRGLGVPIDDLYAVVTDHGRDSILLPDGVHFSAEGYAILGKAVARCLERFL